MNKLPQMYRAYLWDSGDVIETKDSGRDDYHLLLRWCEDQERAGRGVTEIRPISPVSPIVSATVEMMKSTAF